VGGFGGLLAIVGVWFANVGCEAGQGFWLFVGYVVIRLLEVKLSVKRYYL
jgi:hypothetical protein